MPGVEEERKYNIFISYVILQRMSYFEQLYDACISITIDVKF